MHVQCVTPNQDNQFYSLVVIRGIVDTGALATFSRNAIERDFFAQNNVTTLSIPTFGVDMTGYSSGNILLGLRLLIFSLASISSCFRF